MKRFNILALAAVMSMIFAAGCTEQSRQQYDQAGENIGQAAQRTGDAVETDAKVAGEHIENTAENAARAADNAETTFKVKNAIVAAENLDSSDINVDTVENKVVLKGSVPSQAEKDRAEQIAKGVVGQEHTVDNQLTVRGK